MHKVALSVIIVICFSVVANAQVKLPDGRFKTLATVIDGDTIPLINLVPVEVIESLSPEAAAQLKNYLKLRRDVLRAYPYARLAETQLKYVNDSIAKIPTEKQRKRFIKETEKQLKKDFEKDLKNLTIKQGRILIKLVDRQTGSTSYHLVKELRGSFQAFFWQSMARLFGENLKDDYDAEGEDAMIEAIVQQIERGELPLHTVRK